MRLFDKTAFLQKIGGVDAGIVEANIHTIGLVAGDMDENGRKALANFVQFIVRTDCQNKDSGNPPERLSYEELLGIGRHLDEIVQVLSGGFSESVCEIANRIKRIKSDAGRRVL